MAIGSVEYVAEWLRRAGDRLSGWRLPDFDSDRQRPDIATARLERAMEKEGCPVCRIVAEVEHRWLWMLLWENVTDPGVRKRIAASLGFCPYHWDRLDRVARLEGIGESGQAILAQELLARVATRLDEARGREADLKRALQRTRPCPACVHAAAAERDYVDVLRRAAQNDAFWEKYAASDGSCLPHLRRLPLDGRSARLIEHGLSRLGALLADAPETLVGSSMRLEGLIWGQARGTASRTAHGEGPGCSVCNAQIHAEWSEMRMAAARPAHRICPAHIPPRNGHGPALPRPAESYRSALEACHEDLEQRLAEARRRRGWRFNPGIPPREDLLECVVCVAGAEGASTAANGAPPPHRAEDLLCLPHLAPALRGRHAQALALAESRGLKELANLLGAFIRSCNWSYRHEPRGQEQASWPRALSLLAGAQARTFLDGPFSRC